MNSTDHAAHHRDLERRIRELEAAIGLPVAPEYDRETLVSLYICASRAQPITEESALLWASAVRGLTTATLLQLSRDVHDPFPWKPFLVLLDACASAGFAAPRVVAGLVERARDLLRIQGLAPLVDVGDVMGSPLQVHRASAAISRREEETRDDQLRSEQHQEARGARGRAKAARHVPRGPDER